MFIFIALFVAVFTGAILPDTVKSAKFEKIDLPETVSVILSPHPTEKPRHEVHAITQDAPNATDSATHQEFAEVQTDKTAAYNVNSGKTVPHVAGVAINKSQALIPCTDNAAHCTDDHKRKEPSLTNTPIPTVTISPSITPTPTVQITPDFPIDPCPSLPHVALDQKVKNSTELIVPCLH